MKNKTALILCLALALSFAGCTKNKNESINTPEITTETTVEATTAEPEKKVESPEAFLDFGVFINVPKDSTDTEYTVRSGNIAEISFTYKEDAYILRGSNNDADLVFDVNEEYRTVRDSIANETREVTVLTTESGRRVAQWNYEGTNFALISQKPVELLKFNDICMWLAFPE